MTRPDKPAPGKKYSARDIARIFGDVLPAQTKDDRPDGAAPGSGAAPSSSGGDGDRDERWYRENRPPHHGG